MGNVAQVIVDVPLMQTDKPFTYSIPNYFESLLQIGSRVHVPFGRGNRLLQGFVIGISSEEDISQLKEVQSVLDFEPVLTKEQLDLANHMRKRVFSYKITLLKAMIPNLLNSNYDKELFWCDGISQEDKKLIFADKTTILLSQLSPEQESRVATLIKSGAIGFNYLATDKKTLKTEKHYKVNKALLAEHVISNRAKKKQELKEFLLTHKEDGLLNDLIKGFSRDIVNYFSAQGLITVFDVQVNRSDAYFEKVAESTFLNLNLEQKKAVSQIVAEVGKESNPFLLQGITGSGKTEVYLHIIDKVLKEGKTAIVLVPEISLTPQMTQRFISRFGKMVAIMHSGLSDGEKFDEWQKN